MKIFGIVLSLAVFALAPHQIATAAEPKVLLFETKTDWGSDGTTQWWLSRSQIDRLPKWNPQKRDKPPVSVETALKTARRWILNQKQDGMVEEILLRPVHPDEAPYNSVFYYRISFQLFAPYANHMTCIVLMDRTVLEPERHRYNPER